MESRWSVWGVQWCACCSKRWSWKDCWSPCCRAGCSMQPSCGGGDIRWRWCSHQNSSRFAFLSWRRYSVNSWSPGELAYLLLFAGGMHHAGLAILTVPLGVLKNNTLRFHPPLPGWKIDAIETLGFGNMNKVVLQFASVFWDTQVDYFGVSPGCTKNDYKNRGFCTLWWSGFRSTGKPMLTGIISGSLSTKVFCTSKNCLQLNIAVADGVPGLYAIRLRACLMRR